jgi:hypothetical protein
LIVEDRQMKPLLPFALLLTASAPGDRPRTYLVSVVDIPLASRESMESFSVATWGVAFKAVCRIPGGWRIKAGSSATPDGALEGTGSLGATWFKTRSPDGLRNLVLVTLHDALQRADVPNGPDATFKGSAVISTEDGERKVSLTYRNIRLTPATRCP